MGAVPSNTNNYYCSKNTTLARASLASMMYYLSLNQTTDAMTSFYGMISRTDDIYINCYLAVEAVTEIEWTVEYLYTYNGLLINLLYNLGYMFTDILDLIFYDPTNEAPYWYYVAYRIGDFCIRFIYRDDEW